MASSGAVAWNKYFAQHERIETRMKSDASLYDENGVSSAGKIKKNEKVTFINEGKYESKALIEYNGKKHRTSFNSLHKPVSRSLSSRRGGGVASLASPRASRRIATVHVVP